MDFIFSSFLWLIPLASIPFLIHIFNKMNIETIEFSSIRFLKLIESDSINKLKMLQLLLLIIRTLIILFIILMMSRPVIKGFFSINAYSSDSMLSIIYIDDTASNNGFIDKIHRTELIQSNIKEILKQINDNGNVILMSQSKGLLFKGMKKDIPNIYPIEISHLSGNIFDRIKSINQHINQEFANIELYILTDGEKTFFDNLELLKEDLIDYNIYLIQTHKLNNNLSIIDVNILNENITIDSPIIFNVKVKNNGIYKMQNVLLELKIDDINVGQQLISLESNDIHEYTFKTSLENVGSHLCNISLANDDNNNDNIFYYYLKIPEKLNVLLTDKNIYLNEILSTIKKTTNNIEFDYNQPNINLNNYDILFISETFQTQKGLLSSYLSNGGHIIYFPKSEKVPIPDYLLEIINYNTSYDLIDNSKDYNIIDTLSNGISYVNNKINIIDDIKFYKYFSLDNNSNTKLMLTDNSSIWNRFNVNNGIIDIFGFSNNLEWSNFPIKGSYANFMNKLLYSSYNQTNTNVTNGYIWKPRINASNYSDLLIYNSNYGTQSIINLNKPEIILSEKGFHNISTSNKIIYEIASNIHINELISNTLNKNQIQNYFPSNLIFIDSDKISTSIEYHKYGQDLWRFILYLIVILTIIEMLLSNGRKFQKK